MRNNISFADHLNLHHNIYYAFNEFQHKVSWESLKIKTTLPFAWFILFWGNYFNQYTQGSAVA